MHRKKSYLCSRREDFQLRQLGKARKGGGIWDILLFLEVALIHNVSGVQQSDSDVHIFKYGLPRCTDGKESACNAADLGSVPGKGYGYSLQYSCLENAMV